MSPRDVQKNGQGSNLETNKSPGTVDEEAWKAHSISHTTQCKNGQGQEEAPLPVTWTNLRTTK